MSLEPGIALSDIQVYDEISLATWKMLVGKVFAIMHQVFYDPAEEEVDRQAVEKMYLTVPRERLAGRADDVLRWILEVAGPKMAANVCWSRLIHGDLHTGNILFEPATGKLVFVDPRGEFGSVGPAGDIHYDLYKLFQDLYHGYHFLYHGLAPTVQAAQIRNILVKEAQAYGYNPDLLVCGGLSLLATCVPFHEDDPARQARFLTYVRNCIG